MRYGYDIVGWGELMSRAINTERACWANVALVAFQGAINKPDCETALVDLIADLGHLAKKRKLDFLAILRRGIRAWAYEEWDPDEQGAPPLVAICITPARTPRCRSKRVTRGGVA